MFYIIILAVIVLFSIVVSFLVMQDKKVDYKNVSIIFHVDKENIYIPCKFAKPYYDKEVKSRFSPGNIISYEDVYTGFIRITQFFGEINIEKDIGVPIGKYHYYSYQIYEPNEILNGININVERLYIRQINKVSNKIINETNISNEDLSKLINFIEDPNKTLEQNDRENFKNIIDAVIDCLPGSNYVKLFRILAEQVYRRK